MKKALTQAQLLENRNARIKRLKNRWPVWLALLIVAILYEALPKIFYVGPRGLLFVLVIIIIIPLIISNWRGHLRINRFFYLVANVLITFYMIMSIIRLIYAVFQGHIGPEHLLLSSVSLWVTNILVFALWYWNLDAGGPNQRDLKDKRKMPAFLFPQVQLMLIQRAELPSEVEQWEPNYIDYLFLSFNTSTAFSPTDTAVLSRWAKIMGMTQALISLTLVVMLAARAINVLNPAANYLVS